MNGAFTTPSWRSSTSAFAGTTQPDSEDLFNFGTEDKDKLNMFNVGDTELFKASADTAKSQLAGDVPGFDAQANEARESFLAQQKYATQAKREGLLGMGLGNSGTYLEQGIIQPEEQNFRDRTAFERGLASDRAMLGMEQQAAGQQASGNLLNTYVQNQGQLADAKIREQELVNDAMKFVSKQEWDTWATIQGLDESERNRIWQAGQNQLGRESTEKMFYADLTVKEKTLAEEARQFDDRLAFDEWAKTKDLDENEKNRIWQANQNERDREVQISEASLDRQLTREVEEGRISIEEQKLAQNAYQFESQQAFETWALQEGWNQDSIARAWQSSENAADRALTMAEGVLDRELQRYGINLSAIMPYLQSMSGDQAAEVFRGLAASIGVDIPILSEQQQRSTNIADVYTNLTTNGTIRQTDATALLDAYDDGTAPEGFTLVEPYSGNVGAWMNDPPGKDGRRGYYLHPSTVAWAEANKGKYTTLDGKLVQVGEFYQPTGEQSNDHGWISYRDVVTGQVIKKKAE